MSGETVPASDSAARRVLLVNLIGAVEDAKEKALAVVTEGGESVAEHLPDDVYREALLAPLLPADLAASGQLATAAAAIILSAEAGTLPSAFRLGPALIGKLGSSSVPGQAVFAKLLGPKPLSSVARANEGAAGPAAPRFRASASVGAHDFGGAAALLAGPMEVERDLRALDGDREAARGDWNEARTPTCLI